MNNHTRHAFILIALIALVACSPQQRAPASSDANVEPTTTQTPFAFPTYAYNEPTQVPQIATASAATATAAAVSDESLDPVAVERGLGRYEALECGTCHGANGEGVEGQGAALTGITLSETDFIGFLRSGGTVGISHQYATNRLSESGAKNLYQYILSLRVE
jgi:mono/diheme cytochrome c family protein